MIHINNNLIRIAGALLCIFGAVWFLLPLYVRIVNVGNVFGLIICFLLLVYFVFNDRLCTLCSKGPAKIVSIVFTVFIITGFVTASVLSVLMANKINDKPDRSEPVIILGCKVRDGAPSLMLLRRLEAARDYLTEYPDSVVIVSGGQGSDEIISEAECMKNWLLNNGIDASRILTEDKSTSTYENIQFSKELLEKNGLGSDIVLVTDSFHQFRASVIAKKFDLSTDSVSASTPSYLIATYWVREWFGIMEQIFLKKK